MKNNNDLNIYCIYDKETKVYDAIALSYDDASAVSFYFMQFSDILASFTARDDVKVQIDKFMDKLHNSCICKVASFNNLSGDFTNEKNVLADLFDLDVNDILAKKIKNKNESEEKN